MKQYYPPVWRPIFYLSGLLVMLSVYGLGQAALAQADNQAAAAPAWSVPSATALRLVSPIDSSQHEPNSLNNLDCTLLTYRDVGSDVMQNGCFTTTAFGLMDSDTETVLFNGTDEGVRLLPYSHNEVLIPWPQAENLITLDAADTGGSYINLYRNPLAFMRDQYNASSQLTAKALAAPPDLTIRDAIGKPVIVNPQTIGFSSNGSWLVAETLGGSFVRINLATLDITAFAPAFGSAGSPALLKSRVAVSDDGQYVAIANKTAESLRVYDLTACGSAFPAVSSSFECPEHDYAPFVAQRVSGFQAVRHMRFVNDGLLSFEAQTADPSSTGAYEMVPADKITSLIGYLGLGDSYTSGEGAFDYLDGTDTADNMCHLSAHSYPLLLAHDLFGSNGHSVACSGAVINDIGSTAPSYQGQNRGVGSLQQLQQSQPGLLNEITAGYLPGYVAQQRFAQQYQPSVMTVSVGGNDIGFGDILQKCVSPHVSLHSSANDCYNTYEDRQELTRLIDRTVPRWTALYKQLSAEVPGGQLYAIGYPDVVDSAGNCALNVHLSRNELEFIEELTAYLNSSVHQAAANAGVTYVDIGNSLSGHRLCEAASYDVAVNGLTAGKDAGVLGLKLFGKESYHPNALGQALIEQAILEQTDNLNSTSNISGAPASSALLNVPKTGRPINNLVPDDSLTTGSALAGESISMQASGPNDGLEPNSRYTASLDGPAGPILGTITSDSGGNIGGNVILPEETLTGSHTIDLIGQNQAGELVDVTQLIYVPVSASDADGDGLPDSLDMCPGAINSLLDTDKDGIDDTCDPLIGAASSQPQPPGNPGVQPAGAITSTVMLTGNTISAKETPPP